MYLVFRCLHQVRFRFPLNLSYNRHLYLFYSFKPYTIIKSSSLQTSQSYPLVQSKDRTRLLPRWLILPILTSSLSRLSVLFYCPKVKTCILRTLRIIRRFTLAVVPVSDCSDLDWVSSLLTTDLDVWPLVIVSQ